MQSVAGPCPMLSGCRHSHFEAEGEYAIWRMALQPTILIFSERIIMTFGQSGCSRTAGIKGSSFFDLWWRITVDEFRNLTLLSKHSHCR